IAAYVIGFFEANADSITSFGQGLKMIFGANSATGNACLEGMFMAFLVVNFGEIFCAINMRSRLGSIFSKGMFKNMNWWLVGAFGVTVLLTMLPILVEPLRNIFFQTADGGGVQFVFDWNDVLISLCLGLSTVPVFEIGKTLRRAASKNKK
ncbi:MAG: cation transporting ATPase C-terminal domain-containing protein, partial [Oscillospiraceae bacterium]|nr:cation transporting ATPase C-terminal domain-containing protein [Oscillospiraceae bacterium]